ncbi:MAG: right-handed parallel beta-helix repeat-containing protein [Gaiellales bacterium]
MSYTLRGRIESRLAAALAPLLAATGLALVLRDWWPFELAGLMIGIGLAADLAYHRLLPYQPGWLAVPLGVAELGLVMLAAWAAAVEASLGAALAFYSGSWLLAQILGHAIFPLARLTYAEDGGELGRLGAVTGAAVVGVFVGGGTIAWATQPPTVHLEAGVHRGPLVLDSPQKLVGEPGAVVTGGIIISSNSVTVRDVTVVGGENGIAVDEAEDVVLDRVRISGAVLDGINVRRSSIEIRNCLVHSPAGEYAQGIDISFSLDVGPSVVERCTVLGGREGIVTHSATVSVRENRVAETTLRGIAMTEMSMGSIEENEVSDTLGVGIYCGDYSHCVIEENSVWNTAPDHLSGDRTRRGYAILAHFGADAELRDNHVSRSPGGIAAFLGAEIEPAED